MIIVRHMTASKKLAAGRITAPRGPAAGSWQLAASPLRGVQQLATLPSVGKLLVLIQAVVEEQEVRPVEVVQALFAQLERS
jgi:hypothetical protein